MPNMLNSEISRIGNWPFGQILIFMQIINDAEKAFWSETPHHDMNESLLKKFFLKKREFWVSVQEKISNWMVGRGIQRIDKWTIYELVYFYLFFSEILENSLKKPDGWVRSQIKSTSKNEMCWPNGQQINNSIGDYYLPDGNRWK